jgi:hypothetical protein
MAWVACEAKAPSSPGTCAGNIRIIRRNSISLSSFTLCGARTPSGRGEVRVRIHAFRLARNQGGDVRRLRGGALFPALTR